MNMFSDYISSLPEIVEDARNGKMFILVDAEDRENEGDLVIPAQMCTPQAVNFMARFGRGLICLALTAERAGALKLDVCGIQHRSGENAGVPQGAWREADARALPRKPLRAV